MYSCQQCHHQTKRRLARQGLLLSVCVSVKVNYLKNDLFNQLSFWWGPSASHIPREHIIRFQFEGFERSSSS